MGKPQKLTVTELTDLIRHTLEGGFPELLVEGELSNFRPSSTGHLYFTLKDSGASIQAIMFKNRIRSLNFEPKDGMLLRVKGSLSVYAARGTYSIVVEEMERAGEGDILAMLEERKRKLAAEGLFDEKRKRPIPRFPETDSFGTHRAYPPYPGRGLSGTCGRRGTFQFQALQYRTLILHPKRLRCVHSGNHV